MRRTRVAIAAATATATALSLAAPATADNGTDTSALRDAVTFDGINEHLEAFQAIADANGGNRAAGTSGHVASAEYVFEQLEAAGYMPWRQYFEYERTIFNIAELSQTSPNPVTYTLGIDFFPMDFSGEALPVEDTAVTAVDVNITGDHASTSGCEAEDFTGFTSGNIALIQRGSCDFAVKAANAQAAGAVGVIIFNQGNMVPGDDRLGLFGGTLTEPGITIPVVSAPYALGAQLVGLSLDPGLRMRLALDVEFELVETYNVLADTAAGRADRTVVVGGHLDGVLEGPGINDNGSGTAAILETAIQMAELGITPRNRVRFAFWSGEEDGLVGSSYYVSQLSKREIKDTALNLNFDMLGSLNGERFVYDGDGDALGVSGPNGSGVIEDVFNAYFASQNLDTQPTEFDGRSDYFGFIEAGIPAGGLFSGAEGTAVVGGPAYDPCYHQACDGIDNINEELLGQMTDAVAHATLTFAQTTSAVNGTAKGNGRGAADMPFRGNRAMR